MKLIDGVEPPGDGNVADWIDHQGYTWREEVVRAAVDEDDVEEIINVTIPINRRKNIFR